MSLSPSRDWEGNNIVTNIKRVKTSGTTSFYQVQSNSSDHDVSFKYHYLAWVYHSGVDSSTAVSFYTSFDFTKNHVS